MKYPPARPQPKSVSFGRVSYIDPLQWLEEETPESISWQSAQDKLTQEWLASRPLRARCEALLAGTPRLDFDLPMHHNGRWFRMRTPEDQNLAVLEVSETFEGPWRRLVDLNALSSGEPLAFGHLAISPDGHKVFVGWNAGGREKGELRIIDVDSGKPLSVSMPTGQVFFPTWFPDSKGMYYSAFDATVSATQARVYRQALGEEARAEVYEPTHPMVWVMNAADDKHSFLITDHLNPRPDYVREHFAGGSWRPFLKGESFTFRGDIVGDRYVAITNDGASCGRLVSIPLDTPQDRSTWKELVPGSQNVLASMLVIDNYVVLLDLVDCYSRMRILKPDGEVKGEIPLPGRGSATSQQFALFNFGPMLFKGQKGEFLFPFSSPAQSPILYKANVHTMKVDALSNPVVKFEATILDHEARSADGARVPYRVITRAGLDISRPQPTIIYGYGGFNIALVPGWTDPFLAAWAQAGGVLVLAHLRGGGELGPDMWHNGRLRHKQNSFNDLYAIAEELIRRNITTVSKLGFTGGSNGGVGAAVAAVQRPELFRAIAPHAPITDLLARVRDPITMASTLDYGDPNDPEMSEILLAWSPYQNVKDGVPYPALFIEAGENDPRCPAWHSRKMAARVQQASSSDYPALLRVRAGAGHGAVGIAAQRELRTDFMTFFADQLGLAL
jgi:prolyl oligopeptidase